MNHEKEAMDLVDKFKEFCHRGDYDLDVSQHENAKKCALIHVDGIIDAFNSVQNDVSDKVFIYWADVRKEIEKL